MKDQNEKFVYLIDRQRLYVVCSIFQVKFVLKMVVIVCSTLVIVCSTGRLNFVLQKNV